MQPIKPIHNEADYELALQDIDRCLDAPADVLIRSTGEGRGRQIQPFPGATNGHPAAATTEAAAVLLGKLCPRQRELTSEEGGEAHHLDAAEVAEQLMQQWQPQVSGALH